MKRTSFLMTAGVAALMAAQAMAEPVTLRVQTHYATEHPTGKQLVEWADDISVMSGGDITVENTLAVDVGDRRRNLRGPEHAPRFRECSARSSKPGFGRGLALIVTGIGSRIIGLVLHEIRVQPSPFH